MAVALYLLLSIVIYDKSEQIPKAFELLFPITIGLAIGLITLIYAEALHFETTRQHLETKKSFQHLHEELEKSKEDYNNLLFKFENILYEQELIATRPRKIYEIPEKIRNIKFNPNTDLESFIKNYDILLTIQFNLAQSLISSNKKRKMYGLMGLCEKNQKEIISDFNNILTSLDNDTMMELQETMQTDIYTEEMTNYEEMLHSEEFSNDEKLDAAEEMSDSIKGTIVKGVNRIKNRLPDRIKGWTDKIVSHIDVVDEIINIFRKVF